MKSAAHIHYNNSTFTQPFPSQRSVRRLVTVLSSGLLLGVLSLSAQAGSLISHSEYLDYELPKKIAEKCTARDNCPEIEVKYLKTNHPWINTLTNARINHLVVNSKPTASAPITKTSSPAEIKAAIDGFVSAQFADLPKDSIFVYSLMVTPEYLGHVNDFELFEINSYVFTGGAHGMPYSEYLIFDQQTKKQIQLADMLQPNKKSRFKALAYYAYKDWVKTVDEDSASYEKNWPFTLSDNVTLTDKGIDIRYQHYAISPYAYGMPVLSIPYSKLNGIIKPRFIAK
ncbi:MULTISPECIES: RsiV family protein [unclassified Psychrobacter]|uniref:RsiV family protein n=1 Tax=unclassified Psychrobacter TaxID=196806 RepID=UPI0025CBBDCB|nr:MULTISPECIES: RsiV family protein [unclassified Psychrobacter]